MPQNGKPPARETRAVADVDHAAELIDAEDNRTDSAAQADVDRWADDGGADERPTRPPLPVTVARLEKNASSEVRISLEDFRGHHLVDVRVYADSVAKGERVATGKGVALKVAKLPELLDALRQAETEARARGLL